MPLAVRQPPLVQNLQQQIENIRVSLFDFIEQNDRIGLSPHFFGQLPSLVEPDVSGRRADQFCDRMLFHILAHVHTDQSAFIAEYRRRDGFGKLRLSHPRRTDENKGSDRPVRVLQPRARAADRRRYRSDRVILPDYAFMQSILQFQQLLRFCLRQAGNGDSRPAADDFRDVFLPDLQFCLYAALPLDIFEIGYLLPDLPDLFIQFFDPLEIPAADRLLSLDLDFVEKAPLFPDFSRRVVAVQAHARSGFVDQVDRLVRQEAICDIAFG